MHKLLNEKLREENIRGSFRIESDFDFKNKKILLVDDIIMPIIGIILGKIDFSNLK